MNCDRIKAQISWYLYDELDEQERTAVEEHVESCPGCAAELERERAFLGRLNLREKVEPSAAVLAECRHDLMRSIYRAERLREHTASARLSPVEALRRAWLWMGVWRQPVAAVCLLAVGFFGGWRLSTGSEPESRPVNPSEAAIANISAVNLDPRAGRVQISFDEIRRQTLTGKLQDPNIKGFLMYAAKTYGNPGVRLDTVDILNERAAEHDIRSTLLEVVATDRNAGVRLKALEGLKPFARDAEVRRALIDVLTGDDNPGMRVQAIDLLTQAQDRSLVGVLQDVAAKEENNYVRMRCRDALREMNASVETF